MDFGTILCLKIRKIDTMIIFYNIGVVVEKIDDMLVCPMMVNYGNVLEPDFSEFSEFFMLVHSVVMGCCLLLFYKLFFSCFILVLIFYLIRWNS